MMRFAMAGRTAFSLDLAELIALYLSRLSARQAISFR